MSIVSRIICLKIALLVARSMYKKPSAFGLDGWVVGSWFVGFYVTFGDMH